MLVDARAVALASCLLIVVKAGLITRVTKPRMYCRCATRRRPSARSPP